MLIVFGMRVVCRAALFIALPVASFAQQKEQLWIDWQIDYPFRNVYLLEGELSYQTLLSKEGKWRSLAGTATFEYNVISWIDLIANLPLAYTVQKESTNSFEVSPLLGSRLYFSQNRRIDTRLIVRLQHRAFYQIEDDLWESSNRLRVMAQAWFCINGPNLFTDNLWYAILDYEEFIVADQQVEERYANRRRGRIGVGYRLNYRNRFDLFYTRQSSRNEIEGDFISNDNVIQLRYKLYLNPPARQNGEE